MDHTHTFRFTFIRDSYCNRRRISSSTIHIYSFLMNINREKALETILVVNTSLNFINLIISFESYRNIKTSDLFYLIPLFLCILSLFSSKIAILFSKGWYKLSEILGSIVSRIILTIVFYTFLFPLSLFYKVFNNDRITINKPNKASYFVDRNHLFSKKSIENPW